MDEKSLTVEDLTDDQQAILNREITKSYYGFKLKGIVVHSGTADAGHYYCYIQNREASENDKDNSWFCFNDKEVDKFNSLNIPEQAFGGENEHFESQIKQHANDPAMI
jgi:ubiquitin carboxyl-terminal hydrolase 34